MELTNSMLRAAINKAVESGLLARNAAQNAYDWGVMRDILTAALHAHPNDGPSEAPREMQKLEFY